MQTTTFKKGDYLQLKINTKVKVMVVGITYKNPIRSIDCVIVKGNICSAYSSYYWPVGEIINVCDTSAYEYSTEPLIPFSQGDIVSSTNQLVIVTSNGGPGKSYFSGTCLYDGVLNKGAHQTWSTEDFRMVRYSKKCAIKPGDIVQHKSVGCIVLCVVLGPGDSDTEFTGLYISHNDLGLIRTDWSNKNFKKIELSKLQPKNIETPASQLTPEDWKTGTWNSDSIKSNCDDEPPTKRKKSERTANMLTPFPLGSQVVAKDTKETILVSGYSIAHNTRYFAGVRIKNGNGTAANYYSSMWDSHRFELVKPEKDTEPQIDLSTHSDVPLNAAFPIGSKVISKTNTDTVVIVSGPGKTIDHFAGVCVKIVPGSVLKVGTYSDSWTVRKFELPEYECNFIVGTKVLMGYRTIVTVTGPGDKPWTFAGVGIPKTGNPVYCTSWLKCQAKPIITNDNI